MAMAVVNPFRELLNQISHELTNANLRSLLNLCSQHVTGGRKEKILCGLDLFDCLIHCNVIGEDLELMYNLLYFMRKMRPIRKDLIRMVKNFIRERYEPPLDIQSSGESFQSARINTHFTDYNTHHQLPPTYEESGHVSSSPMYSENDCSPLVSRTNEHYSWCCICFDCNCSPRPVPVCILIICFIICVALTIFAGVLWFCKVPRNWYNKLGEDGQNPVLGAISVGVLALLAVTFWIWIIYRKVCRARSNLRWHQQQHRSYNRYSSVEYPDTLSVCTDRSYAPSLSVQAPSKKRYKKRRRGSAMSAPVATSTTTASQIFSPDSDPTRSRPQPTAATSLPSYHDGYTDEDGTSGNYASQSDFLTGEESDTPVTVVMS